MTLRVLDEQGARIVRLPMGRRFDAGCLWRPWTEVYLIVNASLSRGDQAFAAAHEYAHARTGWTASATTRRG